MLDPAASSLMQTGIPLLSLAIWLPAFGAVVLWLGLLGSQARGFALLIAAAELAVVAAIILVFRRELAELQLVEGAGFYSLGIDGISVLFLPLTAFLTLLCVLAATPDDWRRDTGGQEMEPETRAAADGQGSPARQGRYYAALLALCAALIGAFSAADTRLFCLFMTLEAVPAWYLMARYGRNGRVGEVARDYAIVMLLGCALALFGFELLAGYTGNSDIGRLASANIPPQEQGAIFIVLATAFAIRAPVFPLHGWLPRVLEHGPVVGLGVFIVGLKIGTYGFLRFVITPLPYAAAEWGWVLASLGAVGALYGGAVALIQTDLRRLLAYASLSHMGVIVIGLFSLNAYGIEGGLLQMLTIGMAVAGLYLIGGFIALRVRQPEADQLGALVSRAPYLSGAFLITALGAVGLPGTSGFNGEHLVVIGAYKAHWAFAVMVGASTVLTAAYFLRYFQRAFMTQPTAEAGKRSFADLDRREFFIAGAITGMVLVVGLYTGPFIALTKASVTALTSRQPAQIRRTTDPSEVRPGAYADMRATSTRVTDLDRPRN